MFHESKIYYRNGRNIYEINKNDEKVSSLNKNISKYDLCMAVLSERKYAPSLFGMIDMSIASEFNVDDKTYVCMKKKICTAGSKKIGLLAIMLNIMLALERLHLLWNIACIQ